MRQARSADDMYKRNIQTVSEEREEFRSRTVANESFINTLREQICKGNEELAGSHAAIVVSRSGTTRSTNQRMAEMKMNMLEENMQRKETMTDKLQNELLEANAIEAQLRASMRCNSQACGSQSNALSEEVAQLRAELLRTQKIFKSGAKEAYDYHEGMLQSQQDMMKYEADAQRFREDRNNYRDKYDEERCNAESAIATDNGAATGTSTSSTSKNSRKEHEKIVISAWPKIHDLEVWKAQVVAAVVTASGDERQEDWFNWLSDAFSSPPWISTLERPQ